MRLSQFQRESMNTRMYLAQEQNKIMYPALGLAGEAGEVCDAIKKWMRGGSKQEEFEVLQKKVTEEMGDLLWYMAALATDMNINLDVVAMTNRQKLEERKAQRALHEGISNR